MGSLKKVMVVGASADTSTIDVETGWTRALETAGYQVFEYSLRNRLKKWTTIVSVLKNGIGCDSCASVLLPAFPEHVHDNQVTIMAAASECLVHEALRYDVGWVLIISGCSFHPNAAAMLQRAGIPVVTVATESPYNDENMRDLASVSTVFGLNEWTSVPRFEAVCPGKAFYLPTAWTRGVHDGEVPETGQDSDVFFCGTGFDERARLFEAVDWTDVDFKVAGFWPTAKKDEVVPDAIEGKLGQVSIGQHPEMQKYLATGLVENHELMGWYARAKIVLSVHRDAHLNTYSLGPRVYEAAAAGAFQICDDSRGELAEIFGETIPTYKAGDAEELGGLIRYYLDRPGLRLKLAAESRRRVQNHTYDNRLESLAGVIQSLTGSA